MNAINGVEIRPRQIWSDISGVLKSRVVGFDSEGFPVIETMEGWPIKGEFLSIEKYWKSAFLHEIKEDDCNHNRVSHDHFGASHCTDCLLVLT